MQKVVLQTEQDLPIDELCSKRRMGIVVYRRKRTPQNTTSEYAMLAKIDGNRPREWGFVDMFGSDTAPTYVSDEASGSIQSAINSGRKVLHFDNLAEFVDYIGNTLH